MRAIACGRFNVKEKLGAGSFGEIHRGEDVETGIPVAIKFEHAKTRFPQLSYESKLYTIFKNGCNIPKFYYFGTENQKNAMVIELLGKSLEDLAAERHHRLTLKTVLMLADQMISAVQYVHSMNFIHRDIKPDNFMMGTGKNANKVYIIDFGLSKKYRDPHTHEHIKYVENKDLTGTARYASVSALKGIEQSRRDDLEALGYVWLYLLKGNLPWMGLDARNRRQKYDRICEVKASTSFEELCSGFPDEFVRYFYAVRQLRFTEEPDYSHYRKLFRKLFARLGYTYDYVYDWTNSINNLKKITPKCATLNRPPPIDRLNQIMNERYEKQLREKRNNMGEHLSDKGKKPQMKIVTNTQIKNKSEKSKSKRAFDETVKKTKFSTAPHAPNDSIHNGSFRTPDNTKIKNNSKNVTNKSETNINNTSNNLINRNVNNNNNPNLGRSDADALWLMKIKTSRLNDDSDDDDDEDDDNSDGEVIIVPNLRKRIPPPRIPTTSSSDDDLPQTGNNLLPTIPNNSPGRKNLYHSFNINATKPVSILKKDTRNQKSNDKLNDKQDNQNKEGKSDEYGKLNDSKEKKNVHHRNGVEMKIPIKSESSEGLKVSSSKTSSKQSSKQHSHDSSKNHSHGSKKDSKSGGKNDSRNESKNNKKVISSSSSSNITDDSTDFSFERKRTERANKKKRRAEKKSNEQSFIPKIPSKGSNMRMPPTLNENQHQKPKAHTPPHTHTHTHSHKHSYNTNATNNNTNTNATPHSNSIPNISNKDKLNKDKAQNNEKLNNDHYKEHHHYSSTNNTTNNYSSRNNNHNIKNNNNGRHHTEVLTSKRLSVPAPSSSNSSDSNSGFYNLKYSLQAARNGTETARTQHKKIPATGSNGNIRTFNKRQKEEESSEEFVSSKARKAEESARMKSGTGTSGMRPIQARQSQNQKRRLTPGQRHSLKPATIIPSWMNEKFKGRK
ncbi:hypothetical protein TRFO_23007 [Tritrichomonas foetus]|uniref:non-specific serine/threonine protein kinase n=1 Tax=Tritrichomonas foetus TaxID=1144522 RepID=A0A1J4KBZ8_9EUKA|nr:hypothetical protein TRFO_23007 [Tritrichomonas foetus]|eukprot:OHT08490.1 hypothetical protein TRFO_23007 [Tritrichomonas foetus]